MKIKRLEVFVLDQNGDPVSGAKVTLRNVPRVKERITQEQKQKAATADHSIYAFWEKLEVEEPIIVTQCEPPPEYQVADEIVREKGAFRELTAKDEESVVKMVIHTVSSPESAAQEQRAPIGMANSSEERAEDWGDSSQDAMRYRPKHSRLHLAACFEDFLETVGDEITCVLQGDDQSCTLCEAISNASTAVCDYAGGPTSGTQLRRHDKQAVNCDGATDIFLGTVCDQMDAVRSDCSHAFDEFDAIRRSYLLKVNQKDYHTAEEWVCDLAPETLQERIQDWSERISDIMTAYKGVYDLILLDTEARSAANSEANSALRSSLDDVFQCYQRQQRQINSLVQTLSVGPVGGAFQELAEHCETTISNFADLRHGLQTDHINAAPEAAQVFTQRLNELGRGVEATCRMTTDFIRRYKTGDDYSALNSALSQSRQLSAEAIHLMSALREDVRLQRLLPAWLERTDWLATATQGLTETWGRLTDMVRMLRSAIEALDTGVDALWRTYSRGDLSLNGGLHMTGNPPTAADNQALMGMVNQMRTTTDDLTNAVQDIATFIPLKSEGGGSGGNGAGSDGSWAARKVNSAVTAVTGRPLIGDPKSFRNLLNSAFPEVPGTGRISTEPVRAVVNLHADQGMLAAGQDILHHEVSLIVNDALKVMDVLKSIGPDTDAEQAEALREMVESEFQALADEAARVDRPRRSRVFEIFDQLTGDTGNLHQLRLELELNGAGDQLSNPDLVTRNEAQLIAQMDLLDAYAETLENTYNRYFASPTGQDPRDGSFSGRLAFVTLLLPVIAGEVHRIEESLDAVDFSHAERRTTFIDDPTTYSKISVDGALSWLKDAASREGPDWITRSGLIGLNRTINLFNLRLQPLLTELIEISRGHRPVPHPGLRHNRVRNALLQLQAQFDQLSLPGYTPLQRVAAPPSISVRSGIFTGRRTRQPKPGAAGSGNGGNGGAPPPRPEREIATEAEH